MNKNSNVEWLIRTWLMTILISSVVVIPFLKGSTPFFLLSAISLLFVFSWNNGCRNSFINSIMWFMFIYILLSCISQIYLFINEYSINIPSDLIFTSGVNDTVMRSTLFTQFLYLLSCFIFFRFIILFYDSGKHDQYLVWSLLLFIVVGFYAWVYFILFNEDGDFLSNRVYGDDILNPGHSQILNIGSFTLSRFTSLSGEPSMFVFSVLPMYIIIKDIKNKPYYLSTITLLSLVLTFSTTFFLGITVYISLSIYYGTIKLKWLLMLGPPILLAIFIFSQTELVNELISKIIIEKLTQDNTSGIERSESFFNHMTFYFSLPLFLEMFGMGFGFIRSPEFFSTILVNNGLVGFIVWTFFFFFPVIKLNKIDSNINLKIAIIVLYFMLLASVSEYSYGIIWLILGLAYSRLKNENSKQY